MYCDKCGAMIPPGNKFCNNCGDPVTPEEVASVNSAPTHPVMQPESYTGQAAQQTAYQMPQPSVQPDPVKPNKNGGKIAAIIGAAALGVAAIIILVFVGINSKKNNPVIKTTNSISSISVPSVSSVSDSVSDSVSFPDEPEEIIPENRTIMIYMIGSDLESTYGSASEDLAEMMKSRIDDKTNIVLQTGGCKKWATKPMKNGKVQRFTIEDRELVELDNLGKISMVEEDSLADFIKFAKEAYPAEGYTLVLWDHGGGIPVQFGRDELFPYDTLTDVNLYNALNKAGVHFDSIIFDACNMCSLEIAVAIKDHADYMVAAESYVNGIGIDYTGWINRAATPDMATMDYCEVIVRDYMKSLKKYDLVGSMSVIKMSRIDAIMDAYVKYASSINTNILNGGYEDYLLARGNCGYDLGADCVDIVTLATQYDTPTSTALINSAVNAVVYTESDMHYGHGLMLYSPYDYYDYYDDGRASLVSLGYVPAIIGCYDNLVSLIYAYAGDENYGDWYNHEITSEIVGNNYSGPQTSSIEYVKKGDYYAVELNEDDWSIIDHIEVNVIADGGDYGLMLGQDYWWTLDDDDDLMIVNPTGWTFINGMVTTYWCQNIYNDSETDAWSQTGEVLATVNGEGAVIVIYYDQDNTNGKVNGYYTYNYDTGEHGDMLLTFNDEDVVDIVYEGIDWNSNDFIYEANEDEFYAKDMTVSFDEIDLTGFDTYIYYSIVDVYGNRYETDSILLPTN